MTSTTKPISPIVYVFLGVLLIVNAPILVLIANQLRVVDWHRVDGTVEDVSMERPSGRFVDCPRVRFRYTVDDETRTGDRFRAGGFCASSRTAAESEIERFVVGEQVLVFVNPVDPNEAYLEAGLGRIEHVGLVALFPFNAFGVGWLLEIASRKLLGRSLTPTVRYFENAGSKHAELPAVAASSFALGVLLVAGFLTALFVLLQFDSIGLGDFRTIWSALAIVGSTAFVGKIVWNRLRPRRLSVIGSVLVLPNGSEIRREELWSIHVKAGESRPPHPTYYRPIITLNRENSEPIALAEFPSSQEAERLANWIESALI